MRAFWILILAVCVGVSVAVTGTEDEKPKSKPTEPPTPVHSTKPGPNPEPTTAKPHPEPTTTAKPEPKPTTTAKPEPNPTTTAKPEPNPTTTAKPEPKPTTTAKPEPKPTTKPPRPTTTTTKTPAPDLPPKTPFTNLFEIREKKVNGTGRLCLKANMAITLDFTYPTSDPNVTEKASVNVPEVKLASGEAPLCTNAPDIAIVLQWGWNGREWRVEVKWSRRENDTAVVLSKVKATIPPDTAILPKIKTEDGSGLSFENSSLAGFRTPLGQCYQCGSGETLDVTAGFSLRLADLKTQAFHFQDNDFSQDAVECKPDKKGFVWLPVIVGSALVGLIVLVVLGYVIMSRFRNREPNYETL